MAHFMKPGVYVNNSYNLDKYLEAIIYQNGVYIKFVDDSNHLNNYEKAIHYPEKMVMEVYDFIEIIRIENPGRFNVELLQHIPIELGMH